MKSIKVLVIFVSIFAISGLIEIPASFGQGMSNYELEQEVKELKEKVEGTGILGTLSLSGAIELEAGFENGYGGERASDMTLTTVELGAEAAISKWVSAGIILLWEEDDTEQVEIDEGTVTLGNVERFPVYATAGKLVVPFGTYETTMISDPLTLELGETPESAVLLGLEHTSGLTGSVYVFNGDIDEQGEDNKIKCFGVNAGYSFEFENIGLTIGAGWINNIADSDGLGGWIDDSGLTLRKYVAGLTGYVAFSFSPFMVVGEYVSAMDDVEFTDGTTLDAPSAYALELAYTFELMGKEATVGVAYQGTDKCGGILPETRLLASISTGLAEHVNIALEYSHDEDYGLSQGGTGDKADAATIQLGIEF